jgi:DNA-binding transcriptional LysR family regulator
MDRIDAMTVFVATVDEGSLAGAARRLGRSPAAVTSYADEIAEVITFEPKGY